MRLSDRWRQILLAFCLGTTLLVTACSRSEAPSPYAQVQEETTGRGAEIAVDKSAENGSTFNQFFPKSVAGYNITPTQEKRGFAEYKVSQDGTTVAMLSINDTISNPAAADKYQSSDFQVASYPAVDQGKNATGLLVNKRYQVKVLTRDPAFTRSDRLDWLQKFDLNGLAELESKYSSAATTKASPRTTAPSVRIPPTLSPQPAT